MQNMSLVLRKPDFRTCENKDADQLRGNREADQRLCYRYIDSTIPLLSIWLPKKNASIVLLYDSNISYQAVLYFAQSLLKVKVYY